MANDAPRECPVNNMLFVLYFSFNVFNLFNKSGLDIDMLYKTFSTFIFSSSNGLIFQPVYYLTNLKYFQIHEMPQIYFGFHR